MGGSGRLLEGGCLSNSTYLVNKHALITYMLKPGRKKDNETASISLFIRTSNDINLIK